MARPGFGDHPKCINLEARLAERLPAKLRPLAPALARGFMELLWEVAYRGGDPVIGHASTVERIVGWPFAAGELARMMANCGRSNQAGLLDEIESDVFAVHDLFDHAPDYVRKRLKRELDRKGQGRLFRELSDRTTAGQRLDTDRSLTSRDQSPTGQRPDADRTLSVTPAPAPAPREEEEEEPGTPLPPAGGRATRSGVREPIPIQAPVPDELGTVEFLTAWQEFREWRAREKHKRMTPAAERNMLAKLAPFGPRAAIAALHESVTNDWQGVFPERLRVNGHGASQVVPLAESQALASRDAQAEQRRRDQVEEHRRRLARAEGGAQ